MSSPPISLEDYDAIANAVMETERGRWFLAEYARRNRSTDTQAVLDALEALERRLGVGGEPPTEIADAGDAAARIGVALGAARNIRKLLLAVPKQSKVGLRSIELADQVEIELGSALAALGAPAQAALPAPDHAELHSEGQDESRDEPRDAEAALPSAEIAPSPADLAPNVAAEAAGEPEAKEPLTPEAIEAAVAEMARAMPQRAEGAEPEPVEQEQEAPDDDVRAADDADEEVLAEQVLAQDVAAEDLAAGLQASPADDLTQDARTGAEEPEPEAQADAADAPAAVESAEPFEPVEIAAAEIAAAEAVEADDAPPVAHEEGEPAIEDWAAEVLALRDQPDAGPHDDEPTPEARPALAFAVVETRQDAELQEFASQVVEFAQSYVQQPFRRTLPTSRAPSLLDSLSESEKAILFA